jgi:adenylate cyclase
MGVWIATGARLQSEVANHPLWRRRCLKTHPGLRQRGRATMSDVFISYARSTEATAEAVVDALRALGYSVWRDDELPSHRTYSEVIEAQLQSAKAVVVIWSAEAVKSQWVRSEADRARAGAKLVQLMIDGSRLPMPFDQIQCADLMGWTGDPDAHNWRKVVASVGDLVSGARAPAVAPAAAPRRLSVGVVPFANMSGDPEQEYFSDGISEDIITDLSKVSTLSVVARNTAFTLMGKNVDVPQVARQLGVSHVLEGSVRKVLTRRLPDRLSEPGKQQNYG